VRLTQLYAPVISDGIKVRFARARLTNAQKAQVSALVSAQESRLTKLGIHLTVWGPETYTGGPFEIGYDPKFAKPDATLQAEFDIFGANTVAFVPLLASPAPLHSDRVLCVTTSEGRPEWSRT
jgi:hypothetical protein